VVSACRIVAGLTRRYRKTGHLKPHGTPIWGRAPLLMNDDVVMSRCRPAEPQTELYRNASADEVLFVHQGTGMLHSIFGVLPFKACDYIVVPRCRTYRLEVDTGTNGAHLDLLVFEPPARVVATHAYLAAYR